MRGGLSELRHLREEHTKLKRLVADLSLDRHVYAGDCAKKLLDRSRDTATELYLTPLSTKNGIDSI